MKESIDQLIEVLQQCIKGDLNARISDIDKKPEDLQPLCWAINYLVDKMEIFMVEAKCSLSAHADGSAVRRIDERGFAVSGLVNKVAAASEEQARHIKEASPVWSN